MASFAVYYVVWSVLKVFKKVRYGTYHYSQKIVNTHDSKLKIVLSIKNVAHQ